MKRIAKFAVCFAAHFLLIPLSLSAQEYSYGVDFSYRRLSVDQESSAGHRVRVQIDPEEQAMMLSHQVQPSDRGYSEAALMLPADGAYTSSGAPWFWDLVSPSVLSANPGRVVEASALVAISDQEPEARSPSISRVQSISREYGVDILRETVGTQVSPAMVLAVIMVESAGVSGAESSAGAVGLMQLMPATAERFGVEDRTDPTQSIAGGVAYLDLLMETFDGDPLLALAAYNAGENAVLSRGEVPNFSETRAYVPKVLAAWNVARTLCITPPLLMSDGCVFASG